MRDTGKPLTAYEVKQVVEMLAAYRVIAQECATHGWRAADFITADKQIQIIGGAKAREMRDHLDQETALRQAAQFFIAKAI
jgi:hypothetical protein